VRRVLALRPDALTAQGRIFVEEIGRWQKQQAKVQGIEGGETGAVIFVQRFNATLQSFVHLHVVTLEGVFTREAMGGPAVFHEGRAPSTIDVASVAGRVERRMRRWLRRRGLLDERAAEDRSNEAPVLSPMEACTQASLFAGEFAHVHEGAPQPEEHDADVVRFRVPKKSPWSAEVGGFNVHAGWRSARAIAWGSSSSAATRRGRRGLSGGCRCSRMAAWRTGCASRGTTARRTWG
jgi:hypothetical protein